MKLKFARTHKVVESLFVFFLSSLELFSAFPCHILGRIRPFIVFRTQNHSYWALIVVFSILSPGIKTNFFTLLFAPQKELVVDRPNLPISGFSKTIVVTTFMCFFAKLVRNFSFFLFFNLEFLKNQQKELR